MKELEAIKERAEAATKGPWFAHQEYIDMGVPDAEQTITNSEKRYDGTFIASVGLHSDVKEANADFVTRARTDIPKLVNALERVEALVILAEKMLGYGAGGVLMAEAIRAQITEALQ